jgi:hypothetical protein
MREITIHVDADDEDYAHIANAVWMLMRATSHDFDVVPDRHAKRDMLDEIWGGYSKVSWTAGDRRGTDQAETARTRRAVKR